MPEGVGGARSERSSSGTRERVPLPVGLYFAAISVSDWHPSRGYIYSIRRRSVVCDEGTLVSLYWYDYFSCHVFESAYNRVTRNGLRPRMSSVAKACHESNAVHYHMSCPTCRESLSGASVDTRMPNGAFGSSCTEGQIAVGLGRVVTL